jgi:hypothetical protein
MALGDTPTSTDSEPSTPRTATWTPADPNCPAFFPPTPVAPMSNPNPTPPTTTTMTDAQLMRLLHTVSSQSMATPVNPPPNSRVGGTNAVGFWTGKGAQGLGSNPKSSLCMRVFKENELKAYQALNTMEEKCKGGLQAKGALIFGLPGKTR